MFRMDFFEHVVAPSLWNAFTGWGLDFTWPFLLRYPQRHVGVVDEVCMVHDASWDKRQGQASLYTVPVPYDEREEETRRVAEYGYYASRVEAMGFVYRNSETLGVVLAQHSAESSTRKNKVLDLSSRRSTWLAPDVMETLPEFEDVHPLLDGNGMIAVMGVLGGFSAALVGSWIRKSWKRYLQSRRGWVARRGSKR